MEEKKKGTSEKLDSTKLDTIKKKRGKFSKKKK